MSRADPKGKRARKRGDAKAPAIERAFAEAVQTHRAGRLADAERQYQAIVSQAPGHAGALYYFALLMDETGRRDLAIDLMARAVEAQPGDPVLQNNFGNLLRNADRSRDAVDAYKRASELDPGYVNAQFNLGISLQEVGDLKGAKAAFEKVVALAPDDGQGWDALGTLLVEQGEAERALDCFARSVRLMPRDAESAYNHAGCLRTLNRIDEAAAEYRRAAGLRPRYLEANYNLALVERLRADNAAAEQAFNEVLKVNPNHAKAMVGLAAIRRDSGDAGAAIPLLLNALELDSENARGASLLLACFQDQNQLYAAAKMLSDRSQENPESLGLRMALGEVLMELDEWDRAAENYLSVIEKVPDHAGAHNGLSQAYDRLRRPDQAIAVCREAIASNPDFADAHCNLGLALRQKGDTRAAVRAYQDALRIDPNYGAAWNNLGIAYAEIGDIEKALECYGKAIKLEPELAAAYLNISRAKKFTLKDMPEIERLEAMVSRGGIPEESRASLHCALGKMHEDCGVFDQSFPHYLQAGKFMRKLHRFDRQKFVRWAEQFHSVFTPAFFDSVNGIGNPSDRPVFIVGMPRSGTTLVEQILASHPDVYGADELTKVAELAESLPDRVGVSERYPQCAIRLDAGTALALADEYLSYIGSLAGGESRVTDKMPTNFFHLGLIHAMFPNARIIHCQRDAMDVCLSNFVQIFAEAHYYSYDLLDTAAYYREYEKIMAHWWRVLPLSMLHVSYESLVANQEDESRRMVAFLGLPWNDRCLQFHRSERSVRTASNWQVRQPIYKTSTRRWKRFEPYLQDLKQGLGYVDNE